MKYLGLDVHLKSTVWCLLDEDGVIAGHGQVETTRLGLQQLLSSLKEHGELLCGQEVGSLCYFVSDIFIECGVKLLTFNAYHLRMIASSRKKTDKRDAYWLAKALQTGMTPHPVYLPNGDVRELRGLLSQRQALSRERVRWRVRARRMVQAAGFKPASGGIAKVTKSLEDALSTPQTLAPYLADGVQRSLRMETALALELKQIDKQLHGRAQSNDLVQRLMTIPGVGEQVALTLYATVGDISRFKSARELCSYAGLVPSVHQSAVDVLTGEVVACDVTSKSARDASRVPALLKQIESPLASVRADGAYDKDAVYKAVENHTDNRSPRVLIPPKKNAQVRLQVPVLRERNRNTRSRARLGKRQWHTTSGYSRRSMVENAVYRYKALIGRTMRSRTLQGQRVEARVGCKVLNTMTALGMPESHRVA
jgi:transposase